MKSLAINLVTRGRPEMAVAWLKTTLKNVRSPATKILVSADWDDQPTIAALQGIPGIGDFLDVRSREDALGAKHNRVLEIYPDADLYMMGVDDGPHITPGFDKLILKAARTWSDGYVIVQNDLENLSFSSIQAVSRKIVEKMGFAWPPYWPYWFGDHWIDDIARMTGRAVYVPIQTDRAQVPPTQERRDIDFWAELYNRLYEEREQQARNVIFADDFRASMAQRNALNNNFILVRERSTILNAIAVRDTIGSETAADSPRHERLRAKAEEMVGQIPRARAPRGEVSVNGGGAQTHPMSVIFATPVLDTYEPGYIDSWSETEILLLQNGFPFNRYVGAGQQFIANARNVLAAMYMQGPKADNFFFLDADLTWPAAKVIEFIQRPEPIVVGVYRRREDAISIPCDFKIKDQQLVEGDGEHEGLVPLNRGATGFMRIKRWALERIVAYFEESEKDVEKFESVLSSYQRKMYNHLVERRFMIPYRARYKVPTTGGTEVVVWDIFQTGAAEHPDGRRFHGEDMLFSQACADIGIEVFADPDVRLGHTGKKRWDFNLKEVLPDIREFAKKSAPDAWTLRVG
jgi:hypothetical protein